MASAFRTLSVSFSLAVLPFCAFASGSYSRPPVDSVYNGTIRADPVYEQGKAVFNGRLRDYGPIKFCVGAPGTSDGLRISRKSLKAFRGSLPATLAAQLHACDTPDLGASDVLARRDLVAMLHYLDVRYRLKLQR